jgi:hypothetical protein
MRKLILRSFQSPGDILMLTAAVRDLHRCHPGKFQTDVRTSCPALWENNPHLTPLKEDGAGVETVDCHYPLIHQSNALPLHFLLGYMDDLNRRLGTRIEPTAFKGDLHLSAREKARPGPIARLVRTDLPYWLVVAGGKYDYTIKWWHFRRFQRVVDLFAGRLLFVQVGEAGHHHPALSGVLDQRGATDLRQLIQLMYHAEGVLCPVTFLMHLAAAVEVRPGRPAGRPCVVVAGGREPPTWEAYPHHQFMHTVGTLPCCAAGGCWRSRTVPLGDGDEKDRPEQLCVDVVDGLPRCMAMITPEDVVRRIEWHFIGGPARYLTRAQVRAARPHLRPSTRQLLLGSATDQ